MLFYLLLVVTLLLRANQKWLAAGAAASAMTYAGTAAIHAIVLLVYRQSSPFDVDIVGAYAIASAGFIIAVPFATLSKTVRAMNVQHLVWWWGALMGLGTGCGMAAIFLIVRTGKMALSESKCIDVAANVTLTSPDQLELRHFNCTYSCFSAPSVHLHPNGTMVAVPSNSVNYGYFLYALIGGFIVFGVTGACVALMPFFLAAGSWKEERPSSNWLRLLYTAACPLCLIGAVNVNEMWLIKGGLPVEEDTYQIGQWAPLAATALVIVGVCINRLHEVWRKRQGEKAQTAAGVPLDDRLPNITPAGHGPALQVASSQSLLQPQQASWAASSFDQQSTYSNTSYKYPYAYVNTP